MGFRNCWKTLPIVFLICLTSSLPVCAQEKERLLRTLTVTGHGIQRIPTSLSQVSLAVEVQGKTAAEAQQESARRSSSVIALLKSRNVDKLQTAGIRLEPVYSYTNNVQRLTGYTANNTVSFRLNTEKVGNLLDEAVKAGATKIDSVSFIATDEAIAMAQKEALKQATQLAQQQADVVFNSLNLKPKEVVSIQINGANPSLPRTVFNQAKLAAADTSLAVTPLIGGEQQVDASVTLQISY